jgi:hypothetical protein
MTLSTEQVDKVIVYFTEDERREIGKEILTRLQYKLTLAGASNTTISQVQAQDRGRQVWKVVFKKNRLLLATFYAASLLDAVLKVPFKVPTAHNSADSNFHLELRGLELTQLVPASPRLNFIEAVRREEPLRVIPTTDQLAGAGSPAATIPILKFHQLPAPAHQSYTFECNQVYPRPETTTTVALRAEICNAFSQSLISCKGFQAWREDKEVNKPPFAQQGCTKICYTFTWDYCQEEISHGAPRHVCASTDEDTITTAIKQFFHAIRGGLKKTSLQQQWDAVLRSLGPGASSVFLYDESARKLWRFGFFDSSTGELSRLLLLKPARPLRGRFGDANIPTLDQCWNKIASLHHRDIKTIPFHRLTYTSQLDDDGNQGFSNVRLQSMAIGLCIHLPASKKSKNGQLTSQNWNHLAPQQAATLSLNQFIRKVLAEVLEPPARFPDPPAATRRPSKQLLVSLPSGPYQVEKIVREQFNRVPYWFLTVSGYSQYRYRLPVVRSGILTEDLDTPYPATVLEVTSQGKTCRMLTLAAASAEPETTFRVENVPWAALSVGKLKDALLQSQPRRALVKFFGKRHYPQAKEPNTSLVLVGLSCSDDDQSRLGVGRVHVYTLDVGLSRSFLEQRNALELTDTRPTYLQFGQSTGKSPDLRLECITPNVETGAVKRHHSGKLQLSAARRDAAAGNTCTDDALYAGEDNAGDTYTDNAGDKDTAAGDTDDAGNDKATTATPHSHKRELAMANQTEYGPLSQQPRKKVKK